MRLSPSDADSGRAPSIVAELQVTLFGATSDDKLKTLKRALNLGPFGAAFSKTFSVRRRDASTHFKAAFQVKNNTFELIEFSCKLFYRS